MFGTKRVTVSAGDQVGTIIGKGTQFKGSINAVGALRIDGEVDGEIITASEVVVGETGVVRALIKARAATIGGTVHGNMEVAEKLELLPSSKVYSNIKVGLLIIAEGAIFKGDCEMLSGEVAEKKGKESK